MVRCCNRNWKPGKKIENWRDQLRSGNIELVNVILKVCPFADRQQLTQLARNAKKEFEEQNNLITTLALALSNIGKFKESYKLTDILQGKNNVSISLSHVGRFGEIKDKKSKLYKIVVSMLQSGRYNEAKQLSLKNSDLYEKDELLGLCAINMAQPHQLEQALEIIKDIEYFDYVDEYEPPYLYYKSRYINEEFPRYPEQVSFEEQLDDLELFDFQGYGPSPSVFEEKLKMHRLEIDGYDLIRSKKIPNLDDSCGQYLTFRQLVECGETFDNQSIQNLSQQ